MTEANWKDPIVEEVRRNRANYAARFQHDLDAMIDDLKKVQAKLEADGFKIVSYESKTPTKKSEAA